nr:sigma factor-like helix-turn-helix DNA-binding protein [uncultured Actinoplanes sp.]
MPTRHADPIGDRRPRQPPVDLLRRLAPEHREILVATYFRRRTTREAARALGLTPQTASMRLYRAMRELSDMVAASPAVRPAPIRDRRPG